MRYHPYGQERWSLGGSPTDFGFTAQRNEASFGLMDYNARYYLPVLGRFISPDTIVLEPTSLSGFNRYRYVRNSPLMYTDPSSHCIDALGLSTRACIAIGVAVLTVVGLGATVEADNQGLIRSEERSRSMIAPSGCERTLSECYETGHTKNFDDGEVISEEEFNNLLDTVYNDLENTWTPPMTDPHSLYEQAVGAYAGRGLLDTPFYDNSSGDGGADVYIQGYSC